MRRRVPLLALVAVLALAGCGGGKEVSPLPKTVIGTIAAPPASNVKGDSAAGKTLFASQGCGGCHTYAPAGSNGNVGPKLDKLAADAKKANQGSLQAYTHESIANPSAYVVPGFPNGVMPAYGGQLSDKQIADLVAFLTPKS
jgi:mono/diheme cytochrome c family protein